MIDEKILKQREAGKKWRVNNKEKIKAWRAQNKEKILETQRKWRLKNKDKASQYSKNWRKNNPEKYKLQTKSKSPVSRAGSELGWGTHTRKVPGDRITQTNTRTQDLAAFTRPARPPRERTRERENCSLEQQSACCPGQHTNCLQEQQATS